MTPEERADSTVEFLYDSMVVLTGGRDFAAKAIAIAIREAVAAERERCAKIADEDAEDGPENLNKGSWKQDVAKSIAARIRSASWPALTGADRGSSGWRGSLCGGGRLHGRRGSV